MRDETTRARTTGTPRPVSSIPPTRRTVLSRFGALGVVAAAGAAFLAPGPGWGQAGIVGRVTRIQGAATVLLNGEIADLALGAGVPMGGVIETGPGARLIVVFEDASQLTLGAGARVTVDDMVYDAAARQSGAVSQALEVLAGTFLFVSGGVGRDKPEAVTFRTPVATIGIRGTEFFGGSLAAGMPPGQTHYGFMILDGAISVDAPEGSVVLDEFQEGTFLPDAGGAAPTEPSRWTREAVDEAFASVTFS
jgi:hypothetical protein